MDILSWRNKQLIPMLPEIQVVSSKYDACFHVVDCLNSVLWGEKHLTCSRGPKQNTHIVAFVCVGVSVHKNSKSSEQVHVSKHRTCEEAARHTSPFYLTKCPTMMNFSWLDPREELKFRCMVVFFCLTRRLVFAFYSHL